MDGFKKLVRTLEGKVQTLETEVASIQGRQTYTEPEHYVSSASECGSIPLDDLDTYRFLHINHPSYHVYTLVNPSQEFKDCEKEFPIRPGHSDAAYGRQIQSSFPPELVENNVYKGYFGDVYPTKLKNILDEKVWEIVSLPVHENESHRECTESILQYKNTDISYTRYRFKRNITVSFKHSYKTIPQVSFFITPIKKYKRVYKLTEGRCIELKDELECHIQDITTKYVEFVVYINVLYPDIESVLHWQVQGVYTTEPHTDLLSS